MASHLFRAGGPEHVRDRESLRWTSIKYLAEWTDRVEAGELPAHTPERPSGVERNVVATVRDWSSPQFYMHDLSGTDRRDPTVNGYGKLYGAPELSTDEMPILDPVANEVIRIRPARCGTRTHQPRTRQSVLAPSPYWGDERIWDSQANVHNPMLDQDGRVWLTARIRGPQNPTFCREGSSHPSARALPEGPYGSPARRLRSIDRRVFLRRHVLQHPPPPVRVWRGQHPLDERWR